MSGRHVSFSIRAIGSEEQEMAVLLDGISGTRTGRWLKAMAPQSVVRYVPIVSILGVPLAFVVARQYELGKASFYGIPDEFVRVGPVDAVAPFVSIAIVLWLLFIVVHEVERVGIARVANYAGSLLRLIIATLFLIGFGIAFTESKQDGVLISLLVEVLIAAVIYAVLWWLPPGIAWIGRRVGRAVAKARATPVRHGRLERHIFRGFLDYRLSPDLKRFIFAVLIGLAMIGIVPNMFGWQQAQSQETFAVLAGSGKQVILAVYEDKTFTADLDGQRIRTVRMRETADVKDVQVTIEHLGQLRSTHGFLTALFWSGW
jgi:hypothetical protein